MMNHEMISLFAVSRPKSATSPSVKLTLAKTCSTDSLVPRWTLALHGTVLETREALRNQDFTKTKI